MHLKIALCILLHHYWERALVVLKNQSLSESEEGSDGESQMMTVLEWQYLWGGLKVLGVVWPSSLAVVPVQCGKSC